MSLLFHVADRIAVPHAVRRRADGRGGRASGASAVGRGALIALATLLALGAGSAQARLVLQSPDQTFTTAPALSIDSESASNVGAGIATLNTQINPEGSDTTCQFQFVDDSQFQATGYASATSVACSPSDLGSGSSDVTASAAVTGLTPNTVYHFRAVGTNSLTPPSGFAGPDTTFTTAPPLSVDSEFSTGVTETTATLTAQINPEGADTTYQFEYVDNATFNASGFTNATSAPTNPVDLGSGLSDAAAKVDLTGLTPGTTYHFRVIATNAFTAKSGMPGTAKMFTTPAGPAPSGLPDGRAYELVSPVDKAGGEVSPTIEAADQAAPDGNSVAYLAFTPFPGSTGPGINYVATRGPSGWSTADLLPPQAPSAAIEFLSYVGFSSDLSKAALLNGGGANMGVFAQDSPPLVPGTCTSETAPTTPCTGEPSGVPNLFLRDNGSRSFQLVDSYAAAPAGVTFPSGAGIPTFQGASADFGHVLFTEGAQLTPNAPMGTNLYDWSGGQVYLVGVLPNGTAVGGGTLGGLTGVVSSVSTDGSRIVFTGSDGNLYQRVNDTGPNAETVQLDAANTGAPGPGGGGQFMTASADGSKVFFLDSGQLTNNSTATAGQPDLYVWDASKPVGSRLTDLTVDSNAGESAAVQGVLGVSQDGSYVYFVAIGKLASGATPGQENLYVSHSGGTPTFIATLSGNDTSDWTGGNGYTARVTPDGMHLAFDSVASLTGYDNTDAITGAPDTEIFLYDVGTTSLRCVSCNPAGSPVGSSQLSNIEAQTFSTSPPQYLPHNLSDDGSRLFFDSSDALSPRDTNGKQDVYEYENGQVRLISSGTGSADSLFVDASANGNDVFFVTRDQLVPQATDAGRYDLYDARVGGGFPAPVAPPVCGGEACRPPAPPTPPLPLMGSVTFFGPGNSTSEATIGSLAIASRQVLKHFRFALDVVVPEAGEITVSGPGLITARMSVDSHGTYALTVKLTKRERDALKKKRKHRLRLTVEVTYTPATGDASTATFRVTLKG